MAKRYHKSGARLAKRSICQTRHITVNRSYYLYPLKHQAHGAARPIPWIQLKGHWLKQAGFSIHAPVTVRVMDGCLVLTVKQE